MPDEAQKTPVVAPPISEWDALKNFGWWRNYDWVMVVLVALVWVTGIFWKIFAEPSVLNLVALLLVNISLKLIWVISLVFRCSHFILSMHADIHLMPEAAARMAVAFLQGKKG